jgi:threonine dehydratase
VASSLFFFAFFCFFFAFFFYTPPPPPLHHPHARLTSKAAEFQQLTGSFKERGARFAILMLSPEQRSRGVIAASAGNHALGLAYHGKMLNVKVTLVMPTTAPITKVQTCIAYGAEVVIRGGHFGEAMSHALQLAADEGSFLPGEKKVKKK